MEIYFQEVVPFPLSESQHGKDSLWNKIFTLNKGNKILLNAISGKGKTTFTEMLAGIRKDYHGHIQFDGIDIATFSLEDWAKIRRKRLSFVFQDLQLFPNLTVIENLQIKNKLTDTFSENEMKSLLKEFEIEDKLKTPCNLLSLGQQQRVAIVRALCQPFEWIILDEPFSHLDKGNSVKAFNIIQRRVKELNAGFILTTLGNHHDFSFDRELYL